MYEYIIQIADVHIPKCTKKHAEYKIVFQNFYKIIDEKYRDKKCILVICGDLLHNKDKLSAEQIMLCRQFLEQLCIRMRVVLIAGNHDLSMTNHQKLDSLTPIVCGIKNLSYFTQSGYYVLDNLAFIVNSLSQNFYDQEDDSIIEYEKGPFITSKSLNDIPELVDKKKICLYHGTVKGAKIETGYKFDFGIGLKLLNGFDYVLLGDIHKHQYLKKNIAYSGSFVQQNYGESIHEHGFISWNILNDTSEFVPVYNPYCLYKCLLPKSFSDMETELLDKKIIRVRFIYNQIVPPTPVAIINEMVHNLSQALLKKGYEIIEQNLSIIDDEWKQVDMIETCVDNLNQLEYQTELIEKYCMLENISLDMKSSVIQLNKTVYENCNQGDEPGVFSSPQKSINDQHCLYKNFSLIMLSFKNVFSYHENSEHPDGFHQINFEGLAYYRVTGIIGNNHVGKSSILDILLYVLYEKSSRGKKVDILSKGKKNFEIHLEFCVNSQRFIIIKKGFLMKCGKLKTETQFDQILHDFSNESSSSCDQIRNESAQFSSGKLDQAGSNESTPKSKGSCFPFGNRATEGRPRSALGPRSSNSNSEDELETDSQNHTVLVSSNAQGPLDDLAAKKIQGGMKRKKSDFEEKSPRKRMTHKGNDRRETTLNIKRVLCDYEDLVFTSFLFQNDFEGFLELGQSDRVKFFHKILRMDCYERQAENVRRLMCDTEKSIDILKKRIDMTQKQVDELQSNLKKDYGTQIPGSKSLTGLDENQQVVFLERQIFQSTQELGQLNPFILTEYKDIFKQDGVASMNFDTTCVIHRLKNEYDLFIFKNELNLKYKSLNNLVSKDDSKVTQTRGLLSNQRLVTQTRGLLSSQRLVTQGEALLSSQRLVKSSDGMTDDSHEYKEEYSAKEDYLLPDEMQVIAHYEKSLKEQQEQILFCQQKIKLLVNRKKKLFGADKFAEYTPVIYSEVTDCEWKNPIAYEEYSVVAKEVDKILEKCREYDIFLCDYEYQQKVHQQRLDRVAEITERLKFWEKKRLDFDPDCVFCRKNFGLNEKEQLESELSCLRSQEMKPNDAEYQYFIKKKTECEAKVCELKPVIDKYEFYEKNRDNFLWNYRIDMMISNVESEIEYINVNFKKDWESLKKKMEDNKRAKVLWDTKVKYEKTLLYLEKAHELDKNQKTLSFIKELYIESVKKNVQIEALSDALNSMRKELNEQISKLETFRTFVEIFGRNGIPSMIYKKSIPGIENIFNDLARRLNLNFHYEIKYETGISTQTSKETNNTLSIFMNEIQIDMCSGFEKLITSLFMRIAIYKLHHFKSDFIFIDEGFSNLDHENIQKIPQIFDILKQHFKYIFVITHDFEIKDMFDNTIQVNRNSISCTN